MYRRLVIHLKSAVFEELNSKRNERDENLVINIRTLFT